MNIWDGLILLEFLILIYKNQRCLASNTTHVLGGFSEGAGMGGFSLIGADILTIIKTYIYISKVQVQYFCM